MSRPASAAALLGAALLGAALLAGLLATVVLAGGVPGEQAVLRQVSAGSALDPLWRLLDRSTGYRPAALLAVLLVVVLAGRRRGREAVLTAVACGGAVATTTLLKGLVDRSRPLGLPTFADVSAGSCPSGHATATAVLAAVVVLTARRGGRVLLAAVLLVLLAGWAQLALGLHFPSDLLAGWLVGLTWAAATWSAATWSAAAARGS